MASDLQILINRKVILPKTKNMEDINRYRKENGPHLVMTGAYRGFSRAAVPEWGFRRGTTGSSGNSLQESGKSGLHAHGDGERVFALKSW